MIPARKRRFRDRLGIALSGLCVAHCLVLPACLALLPVLASTALGSAAQAEWFHAALLAPVLLVSGGVLGPHALRRGWLAAFVIAAFAAMTGALFVEEKILERLLTLGGAGVLIYAHWLNLRERAGHR